MKDIIDGMELAPAIIENGDSWSTDEEVPTDNDEPMDTDVMKEMEKSWTDNNQEEPGPSTSGVKTTNFVSLFLL